VNMLGHSSWSWCLGVLTVILMSCAQDKPIQPIFNPMEGAWAGIRDGINKLDKDHASEDEWRKASEPHPGPDVVVTIAVLNELTKNLGLTEAERSELTAAFNKSSRVVHFGFECDYHALVFFDDAERAWKVIKY